ncbi:ubiquitin carboxyl-terminal hydrolase 17-like protein B [Frankliniella occidentalis]|uniref:Ubiquitin carboxyl-terminal hydrolase 17-like protein B n=1 Tax=Frankliniella occidentalis TaxID=133901 RepID=A0A9C6X682_FRAOC|nr:ubiquitin carboxyl-terminal hydrolase 17-like protein B [Frankliniella occidentalis]
MMSGKEQDVHEFISLLHGYLENELLLRHGKKFADELDFYSKQTTAVGQIFGFWSKARYECTKCDYNSVTYQPQSFLFVSCRERSIQEAVQKYFSVAVKVDDYKCGNGCVNSSCTRSEEIVTLPKVLRIALQRFNKDGKKINDRISVDILLNVKNAMYKFISGIIHLGNSADGGHYKCVTLCHGGKCTLFNDAEVTDNYGGLESGEVMEGMYVAFYQLVESTQPAYSKRTAPNTPTRRSPFQKKFCFKSTGCSPQKKYPRKLFGKQVTLPAPKSKIREQCTPDDEELAKPLKIDHCFDQDSKEIFSATVNRIKIRSLPPSKSPDLSSTRTTSTIESDKDSESTVTALVSPLKLMRGHLSSPISPSAESQKESNVNLNLIV